ncbi:MAG: hypothetical protein LBT16_12570 [Treponema sp.]|jgi:hypothetical protein|nr:hypothetical protein [Treponema sp.]
MKLMGKKRFIIIPAVILVILISLWFGVNSFLSRSPVLVAGDPVFDALYGPFRLRKKQVLLSLRLERPVRIVRIDADAGEDVAVFTLESAAENPYCVIFPYRYYNVARRYSREYPEIPVGVFQGRYRDLTDPEEENFVMLSTDQELDLYRAGRLAALLASGPPAEPATAEPRDGETPPPEPPAVLIFQDDISPEQREAFKQGLLDEACQSVPRYLNAASQFQSGTACDVAVIYGAASGFLEQSRGIPAILFSWIDPALTPSKIRIVFDDSPLTLAAELVPLIVDPPDNEDKENIEIPSEIQILSRRLAEKRLLEKLKGAVKAELP